ncbi:MAG: response regulator receiver protein [Nitrospira bacterium SG8_3]|nr:MAG: response regulator receiver protein [Nitrospira bacterium SG8_3]
MNIDKIIKGKRVLIVDDEPDVLETLVDLLSICKIDTAGSFEEAKELLMNNFYDITVLDIMGVKGFKLLEIARERKIPALMLTAHALSSENLKRSAEEGAAYYAPKEEMNQIKAFIADVLEAMDKNKSPWAKMFERLGGFYDKKFSGTDWREKEKEFWEKKMRQRYPF